MAAPYSLMTRSNDASPNGTFSAAALTSGKPLSNFALEVTCVRQLAGCRIEPDRLCAETGEPGRHVGGPAAELEGVTAAEVFRKDPGLGLGHREDAPAGVAAPPPPRHRELLRLPGLPGTDVGPEVVDRSRAHHRTLGPSSPFDGVRSRSVYPLVTSF